MLIGERVRLRAVERDDLPRYVTWLNDPEVRSHLLLFAPMSLADEERWFEGLGRDSSRHVLAVDQREGEGWSHVGTCGLESVDLRNGCCTLGIFLGPAAARGKGIGTAAMTLLLAFAFDELRLHRVELEVFDDNERARRVYERLGFVLEGRRREAHYKEGRYHDKLIMSLLAEEHRERRRRDLQRREDVVVPP